MFLRSGTTFTVEKISIIFIQKKNYMLYREKCNIELLYKGKCGTFTKFIFKIDEYIRCVHMFCLN